MINLFQTNGNTSVVEGGSIDTYSLALATKPTANVIISLTPGTQLNTDKQTLTFTTANWNKPQVVSVSAIDDPIPEGNHTAEIIHTISSSDPTFQGFVIPNLSVSITDNDAGIQGITWQDLNGDQIKDNNEPGTPGWLVYLDSNNNRRLDPEEISTISDAEGNYSFTNLRPGTYTVVEEIQAGWKQTYPGISPITADLQPLSLTNSLVTTAANTTTNLIHLNDFWIDPRFANIKGQGYSTVIIDTGIDPTNPLFGTDNNNDGIADRIIYQYDFGDEDTNASDKNNHGSHIASIVASIAPETNLIIFKIYTDSGYSDFLNLEKALQWVNKNAATYKIAAVNLSLGDSQNWTQTTTKYGIDDELAAIASQDIIISAAAGNGFYTFNSNPGLVYPAIDPSVISVGAVWADDFGRRAFSTGAIDYTTAPDRVASFSQRSPLIDIFAPGVLITGANATGGSISLGGTSQATAHISAVATLAQQISGKYLGRRLTLAEFRTLLHTTSDLIIDGDDEDDNVINTGDSYSRVNVLSLAEGILKIQGSNAKLIPNSPNNNATKDFLGLPDNNPSLVYTIALTAGQIAKDINFGNQKLNQPPTLKSITKNSDEDTIITLSSNDFIAAFSDTDSNTLTKIKITSLPTNGLLQLNNIIVTLDQEILVSELEKLTFTPELNFNGNITFNWNGFDGTEYASNTAQVNLAIAPAIPTELGVTNNSTPENASIDTIVGTFNATTSKGDTLTYSLVTGEGSTDNQFFEIVNNTIRIKITPDFEIKPNYTVRVKATNQNGLSTEKPFPINITNTNETPTPPTLSNQQLTENSPINIVVGTLATTDPDAGDTLTYSLVNDADNNNLFEIVGNELKLKTTPDYETKPNYSVRVKVTDTAGLSSEQTFTINITDINEAPTQLTIDTPQIAENSPLNTVVAKFATTDPDANENFTYSLTPNNLFTITGNELKLIASPDYETKASYQIQVTSTDKAGLSINQPLTINITDVAEPTTLKNTNDRTFQISGDKGSKNLTFQISSQNLTEFTETGFFKVDDNLGTINGIKPEDSGYLAAALDRFQIISSIIPTINLPQGFDGKTSRNLNLNYGDIVRFGLVNNRSIDELRQTPSAFNQLTLSEPTTLKLTDTNGALAINWQTRSSPSLTATLTNNPTITLGTTTQNNPQGELIDLRTTTTDTTATFSIYREAAYNNHVYFYALQNTSGTILDGTTTLNPTDPGYIQAALRNSIADINLSTTNQSTSTFTSKLTKGTLFAPIIVVNGTKDALLDNNQSNDPNAYTSFILGNADKTDHIRLLGDNTFGFEDLANGGDFDYNDIIVKVNLQSIG
jgi:Subtilase family/Domain of unknown function (DUF4114)/SdrD B-like domain/Cadherin domain/Cadherin-like domain